MPKNLWQLVLRGAAGFIAGLAVWAGLSQPYARVLAAVSETVIRVAERPAVTSIDADGTLLLVNRSDIPKTPSSVGFAVESTDITFNIILLMALFAASSRPLSDRNMFGLAAASAALFLVHVAAVVSFVEAWYAGGLGHWSAEHYGIVAKRLWEALPYFYSVVGSYGAAIALWWLLSPSFDQETWPNRAPRKRKGARSGATAVSSARG